MYLLALRETIDEVTPTRNQNDDFMTQPKTNSWQLFDINELAALQSGKNSATPQFTEFLNVDSMHCGLYFLPKGSKDMQSPHDEDEMYYVFQGSAKMRVANQEKVVKPGMLLYVKAAEEHSFFEIEEDMILLVIFA
ncbi:MAG: mannose-6-phosphate isomerase-like protein (cupin superfamily) [Candidatus Azotimanducaceae bacterium]|jgi:mannose-6-phosphate isomerase-like protein (cupin superfamily)